LNINTHKFVAGHGTVVNSLACFH